MQHATIESMYGRAELEGRDDSPQEDHVVWLRDVSWEDYERFLALRGDQSAPSITYEDGWLEIMSPSSHHEHIKSMIARLVDVYCVESGIRFSPVGSWTLQDKQERVGAEPDECYIFGRRGGVTCPHLAIEVVWTHARRDKLDIYRKLGVGEVWHWRKGTIQVHVLRDGAYVAVPRSEVLPELDLDHLLDFLDRPTAYDAIQDYRTSLAERA